MLTTRNILYPKADPSEDRLSIIHKEFLTGFIRFSELDESLLKVFGNETGGKFLFFYRESRYGEKLPSLSTITTKINAG